MSEELFASIEDLNFSLSKIINYIEDEVFYRDVRLSSSIRGYIIPGGLDFRRLSLVWSFVIMVS